jgi:O-antigen/teichoic acid export membrane protein
VQSDHNSKKLQSTILNSIGANSFGQVLGAMYQILAVPLYINAWGVSLYGEWLLLSTIPGYLAMSDIGFVSAAANDMTILASKNQHHQALKVFQSIWAMILAISGVVLIGVLVLFLFMPSIFAQSSLIDEQDFSIIIFCLSAYSLLALKEGLLNAGFRAGGLYGFSVWLGNLQRIAEVGSILTALACQWSPVEIGILMLSVKGFSLAVYTFCLSRKVTWIHFGFHLTSWVEIRRIIHPALGFMAFPVANAIKNQGTITLIGVMLGVSEVVIFSSVRTICNAGLQLLKIVQHSFWPEVSTAFAKQNIQLIQKMNMLICGLAFWLGLLILFGLLLFGNTILIHWTLGKIQVPMLFLLVMCLGNFAAGIWSGGSTILMAINLHSRLGVYYLLSTVFMLVIVLLLGEHLSLLGYAALTAVTEIILAMIVLGQTLPLIHQSFWVFTKDIISLPKYFVQSTLNSKLISRFFRK